MRHSRFLGAPAGMKLNIPLALLTCLLAASAAWSEDRVRWAPDFRTACELAAEQRRLVLLHFYNDNCPPCLKLEQNVFSQDTVSDAIAQNYIPVKVHAGRNPQLATRYQIQRWPTDVVVTCSGLEIHRTVSPQQPAQYIAFVNQIAAQAGISSGRQWQSPLNQPKSPQPEPTAVAALPSRDAKNPVAPKPPETPINPPSSTAATEGRSSFAPSPAPAAAAPATQAPTPPPLRSAFVPPGAEAPNTPSMPTANAWMTPAPVVYASAPPPATAEAPAPAANELQEVAAVLTPPPAAAPVVAPVSPPPEFSSPVAQVSAPPPQIAAAPSLVAAIPQQTQAAMAPVVPLLDANLVPASQAPPIALEGHCPVTLFETTIWEKGDPRFGAIHQNSTYLFVSLAERQKFLASPERYLLPPVAMDGFCPVTLRDNMKWQKGDKQFFAVHRGRTYYLATAAERAKFLANGDDFAPVLSGYDVVRFAQKKELIDGKRAYGLMTPDKQIYLFADKQSLEQFEKSSGAYATTARQAMIRSDSGSLYR